ncbi:caspase family protein [Methylomonas methanica]|uniref:Peptidase C14 caspase catalytic subunit p20 n=1 Tax=Methylomonas methanica (strain DSM 25384 / MC09) TaxID=857087 RepID=G0A721_METMM|nr:caspase family protein [Methylomonas methanica]AEG01815.1 peptidase C14 caspase catalytic subunit p20 [Methylomonas methanica MC09]
MSVKLFKARKLVLAISTVLLASCAHEASKEEMAKATEGFVIQDTDKLFVVDCLLPGQVRKLGSQMTYLSARRPIRTTAADCEVRGGEYVAYDRANYASALNIWLPKAKEGDAAAQLYVGEIFEKGLGEKADYQAAAQWYEKAANQGNFQAQLNLGHLYEKGLGVPQNKETAMRWYRKSAGLDEAGLQFTPAVDAQTLSANSNETSDELAALREEVAQSRQEAEQLRRQLQDTRQQAVDQQESLRKAQDELEALRNKLQQQKSESPGGSSEVSALEQQLKEKQAQLKSQQAKLGALTKTLSTERKRMQQELQAARQQKTEKATDTAKNDLENRLNQQIETYQNQSAELTSWLTSGKQLDRAKIDARKLALQKQAREIASLKEKLEQKQPTQMASAGNGPNIELIEPSVTVTRGIPSIQFGLGEASKHLVGRIDTKAGLNQLLLNDKPLAVDANGQFETDLALQGKETLVRLVATDKRNQSSDLSLRLLASDHTEQAAYASSNIAQPHQVGDIQFGKFYALIIGNDDYKAYPDLQTPITDAKSLEVLLRERYGFKTKILLNANRHAIMSALNELNQKLTDQDNLLIYYAGHGEIDKKTQSAYWLPVDSEVGNTANWISSQSITEYLSIMPARHIMVVADSCYSGALTGSAVARLPDGMDASKRERWLKAMNSRKARTVLTSGGVKPVMDSGGGSHSVFANAFLKVLRGNKRVIEDYDIFRDVANQVRVSASKAGFEQTPQYAPLQHAGHEGSPFFFVPEA